MGFTSKPTLRKDSSNDLAAGDPMSRARSKIPVGLPITCSVPIGLVIFQPALNNARPMSPAYCRASALPMGTLISTDTEIFLLITSQFVDFDFESADVMPVESQFHLFSWWFYRDLAEFGRVSFCLLGFRLVG